jgi:hypothetical protein
LTSPMMEKMVESEVQPMAMSVSMTKPKPEVKARVVRVISIARIRPPQVNLAGHHYRIRVGCLTDGFHSGPCKCSRYCHLPAIRINRRVEKSLYAHQKTVTREHIRARLAVPVKFALQHLEDRFCLFVLY